MLSITWNMHRKKKAIRAQLKPSVVMISYHEHKLGMNTTKEAVPGRHNEFVVHIWTSVDHERVGHAAGC